MTTSVTFPLKKRIAITIKPTNDCNIRCRHCYHAEEGFAETLLSVESAKKMMDVAIREYEEVFVILHGGEPTLWGVENVRRFYEYQAKLRKTHPNIVFRNSIQTNGILLDDNWIKLLAKYRVSIGLSFDGPHNDDLRFKTADVYRNMKRMQKLKMPFGVICVESQKSIHSLPQTYKWFNDEGFNFKVLALFMSGFAAKHKELELNINDYVTNLVDLYSYWLYDKNCNISMRTFEDFLKISDKKYCLEYGGSCVCHRICLNPDGRIYPCGRPYTDDFVLGHIDSLKKISDAYNTPAYKKIIELSAKRNAQCQKKCEYFGICKGGCVSSAILEGSFDKIDNTSCIRARTLLSQVMEINKDIYKKFDQGRDFDQLNPRAVSIMQKVRDENYEFTRIHS